MDFDAVAVGETFEYGDHTLTEDEIIEFAERWDPQPFHVDPEAAAASHFGGLVASGWHTCAITMRLLVDGWGPEGTLGSPGVEELRWEKPVRPGDTLRVRMEVTEKRPLESDPGRGLLRIATETVNGDDEVVMTWKSSVFVRREGGD